MRLKGSERPDLIGRTVIRYSEKPIVMDAFDKIRMPVQLVNDQGAAEEILSVRPMDIEFDDTPEDDEAMDDVFKFIDWSIASVKNVHSRA